MMSMEDTISLLILMVYILLTRTQHLLLSGNEKVLSCITTHLFFQKKDFQPEVKATHLARQLELVKLKSRCADPSKLVSKFWLDFGKRHLLHVWINFEMCLMNFAALLRLGITLYIIFMFRSVYIVRTPPFFAGQRREGGLSIRQNFRKGEAWQNFNF